MLETSGLLDSYDKGRFFCELLDCAAHDPAVAAIVARLSRMDAEELKRRAVIAEAELFNLGITFAVYTEKEQIDRILPFDLIPRVLTAGEWKTLETGVRQRVAALNMFLHDIYHDQKILKDGIVPSALVLGNANYRPEMVGLNVPFGTYVHVCGTDIIRDEDGAFRVLEDNARTPSGVSYVLENRNLMRRLFPDLMEGIAVRPVGNYGMQFAHAMAEIAPACDGEPQVVLLSPGHLQLGIFRAHFSGAGDGRPIGGGERSRRPGRARVDADHRRPRAGALDLSAPERRFPRSRRV